MISYRSRIFLALLALTAAFSISGVAKAQTVAEGATFESTIPPGNNFDKAAFRLWMPKNSSPLQAVVVLMPGSNGDARAEVDDPAWREFATRHKLALLGGQITDKPHEQNFIEVYANVSQGSGQALLDGLKDIAKQSMHPELATAPLLLWGMSAGGEYNYEFVAWKPERVAAFVVNKGGIYYTALASQATRSVPGVLFIGGKDLDSRKSIITGIFSLNRRGGALWALAEEPGAAHVVGRSRDFALIFFEDVLPLRVADSKAGDSATLKPIAAKDGFVGDLTMKSFQPAASAGKSTESTVWLPSERVARAWQDMETEKPFDP